SVSAAAQASPSEQVQVGPPLRHTQTPLASATPQELEQRGDELRAEKSYLYALDYYGTALKKQPSPPLLNKIGITQLELQRFHEASKSFERAIKNDRDYADAYNNLGVIYYLEKKYGKAIKQYEIATGRCSSSAKRWKRGTRESTKSTKMRSLRDYAKTRGSLN